MPETRHDALGAHAEAELGIDPDELTSPWHAAWASLVALALPPAVLVGLTLTGALGARLGNAPAGRAVLRNVGVGALTMLVTYVVGVLFGVTTR